MSIDLQTVYDALIAQRTVARNPGGYVAQRLGIDPKNRAMLSRVKSGKQKLPEKYIPALKALCEELGLHNGQPVETEVVVEAAEPIEVLLVADTTDATSDPDEPVASDPGTSNPDEPLASCYEEPDTDDQDEKAALLAAAEAEMLSLVDDADDGQEDDEGIEDIDLDALVAEGERWVSEHAAANATLSLNELSALFERLIEAGANDAVRQRIVKAIKTYWPDEDAAVLKRMWRTAEEVLHNGGHDLDAGQSEADLLEQLGIPDTQPSEHPVDGLTVAAEVETAFRRFITAQDEDYTILTLWCIHTYCIAEGLFRVTPRLALTSPQKGCGKSTAMGIVVEISYRGMSSSDITHAGFFRVAEAVRPTLGIDERDRGSYHSLDTLLNDGWSSTQRGGVIRIEKGMNDDMNVRVFRVFVPVALAGIGGIGSDTLHDRCLEVQLHRQTAEEQKPKLQTRDLESFAGIPPKLLRWVQDNADRITQAPDLPDREGISNRALDNWSVMHAIAYALGGEWVPRVNAAADLAISRNPTSVETNGMELVTDIIRIAADHAERHGGDWADYRFRSEDLTHALQEIDEGKWLEMGDGRKRLTKNLMARMLRPFNIHPDRVDNPARLTRRKRTPEPVRIGKPKRDRARGYDMVLFREIRRRYLRDQDITPIY